MKMHFSSCLRLRNKALLLVNIFLSSVAFCTGTSAADTITVNTPVDLRYYLNASNVNVKLAPGTYTITAADIENGTFGTPRFVFRGNNSTYDFTGVTINFAADIYYNNHGMDHLQILGNGNVLKNLKMVDLVEKNIVNKKNGGVNVLMDGRDNRIEGFHITVKGSFPYGYGDCFGKGGTNNTIGHKKHSAFLIRGLRNHALNDTIIHRSYGHAMFMQAASYPKIEGCYVEGEMRSTDEMLAEEGTGSPADKIDFMTTWGYKLPPGYMKSTGEEGIRAYNGGTTYIDGEVIERGTDNPTILNNTIVNMRAGVTLTHATGTKYVEGCTAIGCERGFAIGAGKIVDCYADAKHGPVFGVDYESDRNMEVEITILPYEGNHYNGSRHLAYIFGSGHHITFKSLVPNPDQSLTIDMGGDKRLEGQLAEIENYKADNITLNNYSNYPIILDDNASNNRGVSGGMVTDMGTNNVFNHVAVSVGRIEAENFSNSNGISTETASDDWASDMVTSIDANDWCDYEIDVPYAGTYTMNYRVASATANGEFTLSLASEVLETVIFNATGGAQTWHTISSATPFYLPEGKQTIKIAANSADWNLNWIDLLLSCADVAIVPFYETFNAIGTSLGSEQATEVTLFPGNSVRFQPEPAIGGAWSWEGPNGFTANTRIIEIEDVDEAKTGEYVATYSNDCGQQTSVSYKVETTGSLFIEAESYSTNGGVVTEVTSDEGSGENVTSIDGDDWMEYTINVPFSAMYTIDYRLASESGNVDFSVSLDGNTVDQVNFASTGGAQSWETSKSTKALYIPQGEHALKLTAMSDGWNINWFKLLGQAFVSPCNLPFEHHGFSISNEALDWSSGLIDISCKNELDIHFIVGSSGDISDSDFLNIYYKIDGGKRIPITEKTGDVKDMMVSFSGVSGTVLELFVQSETGSLSSAYNISQIMILEASDPFAKIEAEDFDDSNGTSTENTSDTGGGKNQGSIRNGNWLMFRDINLSEIDAVDLRLSSESTGSTVEIRLDSPDGTLIGTAQVPTTGNWQSWKTVSTDLSSLIGFYDVYLVFKNENTYVCNINWLQFYKKMNPYERFEAENNDGEKGVVSAITTDVDGREELGEIEDGDYILFTELDMGRADSIVARVASAVDGGVIEVRVKSIYGDIISFIDVPNTGSSGTWETVSAKVNDVEGIYDVYFICKGEGNDLFKLNWLQFKAYEAPSDRLQAEDYDSGSYSYYYGTTTDDEDVGGKELKYAKAGSWIQFTGVDLTGALSIDARYGTAYDKATIEVRIDASDGQKIGTIELDNTGGFNEWETASVNITEVSGVHDVYFVYQVEEKSVVCSSNWFQFSESLKKETFDPLSRIEAEDYDRADGTVTIATTDVDGESELGSIQKGDWIVFKDIDLTEAAKIDVRLASQNDGCTIELRKGSYTGSLLTFVMIPNTGSATSWETVTANLYGTSEGKYDVYLIFKGADEDIANINWLQFKADDTGLSDRNFIQDIKLYPNPVKDQFTIEGNANSRIEVFNTLGCKVHEEILQRDQQTISMEGLDKGIYIIRILDDQTTKACRIIKE